ncbi:TM2 domain-containing protein [Campylobacter coli]|uniref:TM2 domain-containing protein n=2 Tax=Campylobacter coli TaxID=195 RepID=UPI001FEF06CF|nr:TM2 domain-containing protein [Campylobacter coli]MCE7106239.1 TM2 domain-containing protein [Campylobacter coli]MCE7249030.1 TM2 domain-containing protein [Campylobacter coli]MCE7256011.1 TM2 domain-containing protein [Campylobacter coli]MCH3711724.1 TM2 domain-containing protein [Campylobacter coli]MCH3721113.1 TM2 domain-containing protein [Campylobacter coli]
MNRFQTFSLAMEGKVNIELLAAYKDKIETLSDETLFRFCYLELKNPIIGLILGVVPTFILSGLTFDRFYKGDMGLGFAKMAMWAFIFIGLLIAGFFDSSSMLVVWIFNIVALFIWNILDFFLVWQGIKNDNLAKIIQFLEQDNENFISNKQ